jgi:ribose 5-phosphate isomerase A
VAARKLEALGAKVALRPGADGKPYVTDGGHYIVDCAFGPIATPAKLESELNNMVGVVEHGLFLGMAAQVIIAGQDGVKVLLPQ